MSFPVLTCHLGIFGEVSVKIFGAFFIRLFGHTAWHVSLDQDPSRPGIRPRPSALEVWGLNRWAARGALSLGLFVFLPLREVFLYSEYKFINRDVMGKYFLSVRGLLFHPF